jgi:hypothetical protein
MQHYHPTIRTWATDTANTLQGGNRGKTKLVLSQCENPVHLMRDNHGIFNPQTGELRPTPKLPPKRKSAKNLRNMWCFGGAEPSDFCVRAVRYATSADAGEVRFKQRFQEGAQADLRSELRRTKQLIAKFKAKAADCS